MILPRGALIVMYVAIQAGNIHITLSLNDHIGAQGKLTNATLNDSTSLAIQLKIAMMNTIVNIIGLIIAACMAICSGCIDICIFCIFSVLAVSRAIWASLSCLPI
jgi:hypothetical protein